MLCRVSYEMLTEEMTDSGEKDSIIAWEQLIEQLQEIFEKEDEVNIQEVEDLLSSYDSNFNDWKKFAKFDKYKYTRNLVHDGNG